MAIVAGLTAYELALLAAGLLGALFLASPPGQQATRETAKEVGDWVEKQRTTPLAPPVVDPLPPSCTQGCPGSGPRPGPPEQPPPVDGTGIAVAAAAAAAAAAHKLVIPGQKYSDQTCDNLKLDELHAKKDSVCGSIQTVQPPKKPYPDPNGADAAKQKRLCDNLRQREQDIKDCIKAREDIQAECFDSPKKTPDEIERDRAHKEQKEQLERALSKTETDIRLFGCP